MIELNDHRYADRSSRRLKAAVRRSSSDTASSPATHTGPPEARGATVVTRIVPSEATARPRSASSTRSPSGTGHDGSTNTDRSRRPSPGSRANSRRESTFFELDLPGAHQTAV